MMLVTKKIEILEKKIDNLLKEFAKDDKAKFIIAPHVAKISLHMNHLYQDLGFKSRIEMGRYMKKYFPKLAELKPADKLWKKFIYDLIDETAPACVECKDQISCFACRVVA